MKARVLVVSLTMLAAAAAGAAGIAACGSDGPQRAPLALPAAESFRAGPCRDAADPILALGRLTYDRDGATALSAGDYQILVEQAQKLVAVRDRAEPALQEPMTAVLTAIGFVRIRPGRTYDPQLMKDLEAARANLQNTCVDQG
jgi:hypothetical protein